MRVKQENMTQIPEIILKKISQKVTEEELQLLEEWLSQSEQNRVLYQKVMHRNNLAFIEKEYQNIDNEIAWGKVLRKIKMQKRMPVKSLFMKVLRYAALLMLPLLVASYLLFLHSSQKDSSDTFAQMEKQILELKESSLITDDGEVVYLESKSNETLVEIDGTQIQQKDSTLLYHKEAKDNEDVKYNSLVTPRGKVYNLVLADGTKVWLNASSAIKYPVSFSSDIRKVYLTGEAYFEVARDTLKPFIVSTSEMDIEVLGTIFNVMAYPDDKVMETTLVSGQVKVKAYKNNMILTPGMQAHIDKENKIVNQTKTDTDMFTSWRFGRYIFEYENLEGVMGKLSRWYDVQVSFADTEKKNLHFSGSLFKYKEIDETLHIIELATNVRFDRSENFIIVR
jgi:ferric-dicitrate binding protein FerR (iron transport regulator)